MRLRYDAAVGCPDVAAYLEHVRARASNLDVDAAPDAEPAENGVDVDVQAQADGWLGRVDITGPSALSREVRGERCEDVVAALALITVLRFEGAEATALSVAADTAGATSAPAGASAPGAPDRASGEAAVPSPAAPSPATPSPAAPSTEAPEAAPNVSPAAPATPAEPAAPPVDTPAASPPAVPAEASSAPPAEPAEREPELPPPLERDEGITVRRPPREAEPEPESPAVSDTSSTDEVGSTWPATMSAGARAGFAWAPGRALNVALTSELRFGETAASWASTLSLGLAFGRERVEPADLNFTLLTAELGLCPPAFIDQPSVWLRACAGVRGGVMRVAISPRVEDVVEEDKPPRPWLVLGPSLELGVPLGEDWTLRGLAAVTAQLIRDSFKLTVTDGAEERDPYPVYEPEAISFEIGVGVSYTF